MVGQRLCPRPQAGDLWLEVRTGGGVVRYTIAPCLVREPFMLDPAVTTTVTTTDDLLRSMRGEPLPRVTAVRVLASPVSHYGARVQLEAGAYAIGIDVPTAAAPATSAGDGTGHATGTTGAGSPRTR